MSAVESSFMDYAKEYPDEVVSGIDMVEKLAEKVPGFDKLETYIDEKAYKYAAASGGAPMTSDKKIKKATKSDLWPREYKGYFEEENTLLVGKDNRPNMENIPNMLRVYLGLDDNPLTKSNYQNITLDGTPIEERNPNWNTAGSAHYSIKPWSRFELMGIDAFEGTEEPYKSDLLNTGFIEDAKKLLNFEVGEEETLVGGMNPSNLNKLLNYESGVDIANYTKSVGRDEEGLYFSILDKWDFDPKQYSKQYGKDSEWQAKLLDASGDPVFISDKYYFTDADIEKIKSIAHYGENIASE